MADEYLIWWTSQADCERIVELDSWPTWLAKEYRSRVGRNGRGRLWVSTEWAADPGIPEEATWAEDNWLCQAANDAGGVVIRASDLKHVQFLPGFITTFEMTLPVLAEG